MKTIFLVSVFVCYLAFLFLFLRALVLAVGLPENQVFGNDDAETVSGPDFERGLDVHALG
jgi:hypothetical protein